MTRRVEALLARLGGLPEAARAAVRAEVQRDDSALWRAVGVYLHREAQRRAAEYVAAHPAPPAEDAVSARHREMIEPAVGRSLAKGRGQVAALFGEEPEQDEALAEALTGLRKDDG